MKIRKRTRLGEIPIFIPKENNFFMEELGYPQFEIYFSLLAGRESIFFLHQTNDNIDVFQLKLQSIMKEFDKSINIRNTSMQYLEKLLENLKKYAKLDLKYKALKYYDTSSEPVKSFIKTLKKEGAYIGPPPSKAGGIIFLAVMWAGLSKTRVPPADPTCASDFPDFVGRMNSNIPVKYFFEPKKSIQLKIRTQCSWSCRVCGKSQKFGTPCDCKKFYPTELKQFNHREDMAKEVACYCLAESNQSEIQDYLLTLGESRDYLEEFSHQIVKEWGKDLTKVLGFLNEHKIQSESEAKTPPIEITEVESLLKIYKDKTFKHLIEYSVLSFNKSFRLNESYVPLFLKDNQRLLKDQVEQFSQQEHPEKYQVTSNKLTLPEIIQNERRIMIIGNPGSGKTTELKKNCLDICQSENLLLPLYVPIRNLTATDKSLFDFIRNDLNTCINASKIDVFLNYFIDTGKIVLFIDGIDELDIEDPQKARKKLRELNLEINQIIKRNENSKVICSIRKESLIEIAADCSFFIKEFEVMPLSKENIQLFIQKWWKREPNIGLKLIKEISQTKWSYLAKNPLLLVLICATYERTLNLPQRISELYKRAIDVWIEEWDATRRIQRTRRIESFSADKMKDVLYEIALQYHLDGKISFETDDVIKRIAAILPKLGINSDSARAAFDDIRIQSGLLCSWDVKGIYAFPHISFQQYFVAVSLREKTEGFDVLRNHMNSPFWKEVLFFYAELGDASEIVNSILNSPENIIHSNIFLAGSCLVRGIKLISNPNLRKIIIDKLEKIAESEIMFLKKAAIDLLVKISPEGLQEFLKIHFMHNGKYDLKAYAFRYAPLVIGPETSFQIFEQQFMDVGSFPNSSLAFFDDFETDIAINRLKTLFERVVKNKDVTKNSADILSTLAARLLKIGSIDEFNYLLQYLRNSDFPSERIVAFSFPSARFPERQKLYEELLKNSDLTLDTRISIARNCGPKSVVAKDFLFSIVLNSELNLPDSQHFAMLTLEGGFDLSKEDLNTLKKVLFDSNPKLDWGTNAVAALAIVKINGEQSKEILVEALKFWDGNSIKIDKKGQSLLVNRLRYFNLITKEGLTYEEIMTFLEENQPTQGKTVCYIRLGLITPIATLRDWEIGILLKLLGDSPTAESLRRLSKLLTFFSYFYLPDFILNQKYCVEIQQWSLKELIWSCKLNPKSFLWKIIVSIWNKLELNNPLRSLFSGDYPGKIRFIQQEIDIDPLNVDLRWQLASEKEAGEDLAGAAEAYQGIIKISPKIIMAWINLAIAKIKLGAHIEAKKYLEQAVSLSPDQADIDSNPRVYYDLGSAYALLEDKINSLDYLQKAANISKWVLDRVKTDPDFDKVRGSQEFQLFLQKSQKEI